MNYPTKMLIDHHIRAKTPLRALGGYVRHFEERADSTGSRYFKRKALQMREVITSVFIHRYTEGEYVEEPG